MSELNIKNKVDDYYGYNDTVSSLISKMCLEAYELFDKEKANGNSDRVSMARAIGDTIRNNMVIYSQNYSLDREMISRGYLENQDYIKHLEKSVFMKFAENLYESNNYRVDKTKNFYEYILKYQLAVFNIGELKNEK